MTENAAKEAGTAVAVPDLLLDVRSGELLPATPGNAAELWLAADEYEQRMRGVKRDCAYVLLEESARSGKGTMHFPAGTATVRGGPGKGLAWDFDVLEQLRDLGLPDERFDELVKTTVTQKVDARVAKQLRGANPDYAAVIDKAEVRTDTTAAVYVK